MVQPLINRARKNECEKCLSRQRLQVQLVIPIEVLGDRFEKQYPSDEFDQVAWKQFFNRNAKFRTLCLKCIQEQQEIDKEKMMRRQKGLMVSDDESDGDGMPKFGPVFLSASATAILLKWKRKASAAVRKRGGRTGGKVYISDDDEDDDDAMLWAKNRVHLNAASKAIAIKWLRMARNRTIVGGRRRDLQTLDGGRKRPPIFKPSSAQGGRRGNRRRR